MHIKQSVWISEIWVIVQLRSRAYFSHRIQEPLACSIVKKIRQYRQIPTKTPGVTQSFHLGNQAGFVLRPHRSMNVQKKTSLEWTFLGSQFDYTVLDQRRFDGNKS